MLLVEGCNFLIAGCLCAGFGLLGLEGVESGRLSLSLLFESLDEVTLGPAGEGSKVTERNELSLGLQAESPESIWHDHALLLVIRGGAALEDLQLAKSGGASWQLAH